MLQYRVILEFRVAKWGVDLHIGTDIGVVNSLLVYYTKTYLHSVMFDLTEQLSMRMLLWPKGRRSMCAKSSLLW